MKMNYKKTFLLGFFSLTFIVFSVPGGIYWPSGWGGGAPSWAAWQP